MSRERSQRMAAVTFVQLRNHNANSSSSESIHPLVQRGSVAGVYQNFELGLAHSFIELGLAHTVFGLGWYHSIETCPKRRPARNVKPSRRRSVRHPSINIICFPRVRIASDTIQKPSAWPRGDGVCCADGELTGSV